MSDLTVIILSKPGARVAQLDLLRRSIDRFWPEANNDLRVLCSPAGPAFAADLDEQLRYAGEHVCFLTDDGVFYRHVWSPCWTLQNRDEILCHSLRLGVNTVRCYPTGTLHENPRSSLWDWTEAEFDGDYGYPGSVDAHVFRRHDIAPLAGMNLQNPTALEVALNTFCVEFLASRRPLMSSPTQSCYVSVPVNRVSKQSGVRYGETHWQTANELNQEFRHGLQIRLDSIRPELVDAAHVEFRFGWEPKPALVAA